MKFDVVCSHAIEANAASNKVIIGDIDEGAKLRVDPMRRCSAEFAVRGFDALQALTPCLSQQSITVFL